MASPVEPIPEDLSKNRGMFSSSWADPYFSYLKIGTNNSITGIFRWGMCGAFFFQFLCWVYLVGLYYSITALTYNGEGREWAKCWKVVWVCVCVYTYLRACHLPQGTSMDSPILRKYRGKNRGQPLISAFVGHAPRYPWWRRSNEINPQTLGSGHRTETSVCPSKRYTLAKCTLLSKWPDAPRRIRCITLFCTCSAVLVT